jgi:hypothetical protein
MDYRRLVKQFDLPASFKAPQQLAYDDLIARPLTRQDLEDDLAAVNSSLDIIRQTRGGSWPSEPLSKDFDLLDLAWHEREFCDSDSFAYVVYDTASRYIGCFYLYPMGHRTPLSQDSLAYDTDASWWVTASAYEQGYYEKPYAALGRWLPANFPFENVYYYNQQIPAEESLRG